MDDKTGGKINIRSFEKGASTYISAKFQTHT